MIIGFFEPLEASNLSHHPQGHGLRLRRSKSLFFVEDLWQPSFLVTYEVLSLSGSFRVLP